jgi:hypothetical protein
MNLNFPLHYQIRPEPVNILSHRQGKKAPVHYAGQLFYVKRLLTVDIGGLLGSWQKLLLKTEHYL